MKAKYTVTKIAEATFALEEKSPLSQCLCYLLAGEDSALLIDTGLGFGGLRETVTGLTGKPVAAALTHAHVDHIGGAAAFGGAVFHEDDKDVFAKHTNADYTYSLLAASTPLLLRLVAGRAAKRILALDTGGEYGCFSDGHIFRLGGRDVEAIHTPGHTPGSVCFLDRSARLLFSGDTVCEKGVLLNLESCSAGTFLSSLMKLKRLEGEYDALLPGHHGFPAGKALLNDYIACAESAAGGTAGIKSRKGSHYAEYGGAKIVLP